MKPTDRLIKNIEDVIKFGGTETHFYVGKFTGYGPGVIPALRKRGYKVTPHPKGGWVLSK